MTAWAARSRSCSNQRSRRSSSSALLLWTSNMPIFFEALRLALGQRISILNLYYAFVGLISIAPRIMRAGWNSAS